MDLLQLWGLVRRNWLLIAFFLLAGAALGAAVSFTQPVLYSATSTGYVVAGNSATVGDAFAGSGLAAEKAETYLPLVQSRSVSDAVKEELGLSGGVSLSGSSEGVIFRITATAPSAELARKMADAAIRATSDAANELETLTVSGESSGATVVQIVPMEAALTPMRPVSPNWTRNLTLGTMLGLLAGFGLVVLRATVDRRIRKASDLEEITGVSVLTVIPRTAELASRSTLTRNGTAAAEAMRQLRTNLRFVNIDRPPRSIVVTSANAGEGKSTLAANLAGLLADSGQPTILIDADLRRPTQADIFVLDSSVGLTEVLAGVAELPDALVPTSHPNLLLLPVGRARQNPSEVVGSERMRNLITSLAEQHTVIIDAPPLLPVTDAELLTVASDGAILVVRVGSTRAEQVAHAARKLKLVNGKLLGTVLNLVETKELGAAVYGAHYGSYQSEYYTSEDRPTAGPAHAAGSSRASGRRSARKSR